MAAARANATSPTTTRPHGAGGARPERTTPERAPRRTYAQGTAEWADHCVALAERRHLWHTARRVGTDEYGRAVYTVPRGVEDATKLRPWGDHRVIAGHGRYACDCPAWAGHGYCSHVGAVLVTERQTRGEVLA